MLMSMMMIVFSNRTASMREWQAGLEEDGFDLLLHQSAVFEELSGFLPVRLDGAGTGFEVYHEDCAALVSELSEQGWDVGGPWQYAMSFYFGGDFRELISVLAAAGSYARVTGGVVFDGEEAKVQQPVEVLDEARRVRNNYKDKLDAPRYEWRDAQ
ncbi:hypothetical protein C4375_10880 [Devosia sp. I507]|nr:hypothetical protein C4375_10880 [Devosia sp. I507]